MANWPTTTSKEDSKHFKEEYEDNTIRSKSDGGYEHTRARHTRTPRRTFTTGYSGVNNADKGLIETFERDTAVMGAIAFNYTHPQSAEVVSVRLVKPIQYKYVGIGDTERWNITQIVLKEV